MPSNLYWIDVRHEGLHAYRRITGRDQYVVQQKADAQVAAWNEKWAKIQQRESALRTKGEKKEEALRLTQDATEALERIDSTLALALSRNAALDWELLKDHSGFGKAKPSAPPKKEFPPEPNAFASKYQATLDIWDRLFSSRRQRKLDAARTAFDKDHAAWKQARSELTEENAAAQTNHHQQVGGWNTEKAAFTSAEEAKNAAIDAQRTAYTGKASDAIFDYSDIVLANSEYPDTFPKSWRLDYNPETKLLLIEYSLPNIDALPKLKEVKYSPTRDEFNEVHLQDSALERMYDVLLYKITLRSIYEVFEADVIGAVDSVVFNGWVNAIDKATGQKTNGCILSVHVSKTEFSTINLAQIDPKACFKKLKGVGSSKLAALVPVRPILQLDTQDERFVPSHEVAAGLDDSVNLAAMDWEDFEHLIREVFEKEFNTNGAEVKITRASRDGGVDAVVFDPDPLRGGKIVIQAKRYTNTVGVSAVRDLYGTVMNEGANKGILVSTADYGPDAYEFVKDKPLALLSGSNLLHLLEKHGHRAKIDLKEAKQILLEAAHNHAKE